MALPEGGQVVTAALHREPDWPEGFYWSEEEGRPVYMAQRDDSSASVDGGATASTPSLRVVGVPHLERACELLWQHGHPAVAGGAPA